MISTLFIYKNEKKKQYDIEFIQQLQHITVSPIFYENLTKSKFQELEYKLCLNSYVILIQD